MKNFLQKFSKLVLRNHLLFDIYEIDLNRRRPVNVDTRKADEIVFKILQETSSIKISECLDIRKCISDINPESKPYGAWKNEQLVGVCWVWNGAHYLQHRNFLPLAKTEGELVYLAVAPLARGYSIAPRLLWLATKDARERGLSKLYARIWHSNTASKRSFEKAGWKRVFKVIVLSVRGLKKPIRFKV